ncbi:hypothetical protein GOODEAATRI_003404 [Goodea atripinnis]|uniref:Uncharacterized protein n=1 Tax=Goodea atripinnis TaxID=208336 RepID=A0ABV0P161_9TELE
MHKKSHLSQQRDDIHVCIMCLRAIMNYQVSKERNRFEKLMEYFINDDNNIDFMIQAYLDNVLDVGALLEDAENRGGVLDHVDELQNHNVQIVLAFGNYMNSSKRGAAYGFRLQSLDLVRPHDAEDGSDSRTKEEAGEISDLRATPYRRSDGRRPAQRQET